MWYEKVIDILRFSLDRVVACADTATPDSGERGGDRTDRVEALIGPCDKTHEASPGFKQKTERVNRTAVQRTESSCFAEQAETGHLL